MIRKYPTYYLLYYIIITSSPHPINMSLPCTITIEYKSGKYRMSGQAAFGFTSATGSTTLMTIEQIAQIAQLYNRQVFQDMSANHQSRLDVEAKHHDQVLEHVRRLPTPPTIVAKRVSRTPSPLSDDTASSESSGPSNQLWHIYVRLIKSQNSDLTHKQAVAKAKLSYPAWKAAQ